MIFPKIEQLINRLNFETIRDNRKYILNTLTEYIQAKVSKNQEVRVNFICTHNSRRSFLCQVWSQVLSNYFSINHFYAYSGGTETTTIYSEVLNTLKSQGFETIKKSEGKNPIYFIKFADNSLPIIGFSKKYNDVYNPIINFATVMTCSNIDAACPIISNSDLKISITYDDPKIFDNSKIKSKKYVETSLVILSELKYVFSNIKIK